LKEIARRRFFLLMMRNEIIGFSSESDDDVSSESDDNVSSKSGDDMFAI